MAVITLGENTICDYTGVTSDTWLRLNYPNYNYGIDPAPFMGGTTSANRGRFMIKFNLDILDGLIKTDHQIDSAILHFFSFNVNYAGPLEVKSYEILVSWVPGTKNNATPATNEPCWNYRLYNSTSWGTAGALSSSDINLTSTDSVNIDSSVDGSEWELDVTSIIKSNFTSGNDYGILVGSEQADSAYIRMSSSEYTVYPTYRPYLEINYSPQHAMPMFFRA